MKRLALCVVLATLMAAGSNAWACGDKMVQVGRGVRYQRANAVRPASIVMFLSPRFDRQAADHLRSELAVVGHRVQVVNDGAALATLLASKHYDILLTDEDDLALATEQVRSMASRPRIIPIVDHSRRASADIEGRYPFVLLLSARTFDQLALITRAMR